MHQTSEENVKRWLGHQHNTHGTNVPMFDKFDGTNYEEVLKELAVEVYTFVENKREYSQTIKLSWQ